MNRKPTFLRQNRPMITCMIQEPTPTEVQLVIRNAAYDGCDAYGFQMESLEKQYRDEDTLRGIFAAMRNKPAYVTNYRGGQNEGMSDAELTEGLITLLRCGATLLDVTGDCYDPQPEQMTYDAAAVKKQRELIARIHEMGGEVLMSSHVMRFLPGDEVLRIAQEQASRGADIAKIVTAANSEDEELENLRTTQLLRRELEIPFLFLSGGSHNRLHRTIGPLLGCTMWLTVQRYDKYSTRAQPVCRAIRAIADNFDY
ncbi:MAG: type I 3-dehydroquinate dehydratase [Clostridiales bacterium]|nr:type I 3-dehydroquinate dehydratase [Clostridiales bacterium]